MDKVIEILEVLVPEGLIEIVLTFEVGLNNRVKTLLLVERSARRDPHYEKADGDDQKKGGNRGEKSPYYIAQHRCCPHWPGLPWLQAGRMLIKSSGCLLDEAGGVDVHYVVFKPLQLGRNNLVVGVEDQSDVRRVANKDRLRLGQKL